MSYHFDGIICASKSNPTTVHTCNTMLMTLVARASDGRFLSGSSDDNPEVWKTYKQHANTILRKLDLQYESFDVEVPDNKKFLGLVHDGVVYMCLFENSFSKKVGLSYLADLRDEFSDHHKTEVANAKPYQFVEFSRTMSALKKKYSDKKSQDNLEELSNNINEIHHTMSKNIKELAERGEKLDSKLEGARKKN
eukprot:TRINITY_DN1791_c0_g1_i3.p1 TRINITY_DN1791_c0_g1~~TRINITY_DN1791_c0_g1_i3.p1  ORF type:complete len:194 (-),score=54.85 TRINITY_DN1791_c0_g1_i3:329-910(-)